MHSSKSPGNACWIFGRKESDKLSGTVSSDNDMIAGFLFSFSSFRKRGPEFLRFLWFGLVDYFFRRAHEEEEKILRGEGC
jgi:hypothetical protein